ncbi:MAG TPA: transporter substrate-binding domain-containing protein [Xanthobacteraceae bacterium]|nr:transporter substrate-binding domain-containing protein [Xanthobacteraceae bacterium]
MSPADPRVAALAAAGAIRLALFLPQYAEDAAGIRGIGTGFIAFEIVGALAARLGIVARVIKYPSPTDAVAGLQDGACDLAFLGIEPSRVAVVDFSPALFQFDYSLLVPAGSTIGSLEDADRAGSCIGLVDGHASALALRRIVKQAELIGVELPESAFDLLRDRKVDALAFPRDQLIEFAERLPGARVLAKGYGVNRVGMAVAKASAGLLSYLSDFATEAKTTGLVRRAITSGRLCGFDVAAA